MKISELHPKSWQQLLARRAQLPHALLLSGQRGCGKYALARCFVESLLCENPQTNGQACGHCPACGWMAQGSHPDFRELQPNAALTDAGETEAKADNETKLSSSTNKKKPSQQITIDQVRALDDFLHIGTHRQGLRIILINPAEAMNRATANSLLKSLEEPISGTLFVLVSSDSARLLPTIRSRCQTLPIALPAKNLAETWLMHAGISDNANCLALAGGAPLLALAFENSQPLHAALLSECLLGEKINALQAAANIDHLLKADQQSASLKSAVEWMQKWIFDLSMSAEGLPIRYFLAQKSFLQQLAKLTNTTRLLSLQKETLQYKRSCEQPLNSRLFFEIFFINYAALFKTF